LPRLPNVHCTPERPRTTSVRFEYWRKLGSDALASTATSHPVAIRRSRKRSCASTEVGTELCVSSQGGVSSRPPVSLRDAVHAGGTGELHAGGPPGCLPRNSTSSERRLTRVVSPRPVYGDALASFRNTGPDVSPVARLIVRRTLVAEGGRADDHAHFDARAAGQVSSEGREPCR
jgi:hypothetical protein